MSTLITRVVVSSAARLSGTIDSYDAIFPWEIRGVISVSLVSATIPYPEQFLVSGAYVILRIDGMEVSMSNDDVLDRCFVAIPCVDNIQKILPTTYSPVTPISRLFKMRVSFVDATGTAVDFGAGPGTDHILQFDIEHTGHVLPIPKDAVNAVAIMDAVSTESDADPYPFDGADGTSELAMLIKEGDRLNLRHKQAVRAKGHRL